MVAESERLPRLRRRSANFSSLSREVSPLNIGELWAVPQMLRLRLVECLRSLAIEVEQLQRGSEQADFWASRLISGGAAQSGAVAQDDGGIGRTASGTERAFCERAGGASLRRRGGAADRDALARAFSARASARSGAAGTSAPGGAADFARQSDQQLPPPRANSVAGAFRASSRVDIELAKDPAGVYARLDFETRNCYRDAMEQMARWSKTSELEIVDAALALAKTAEDEVMRHVGYYLIDAGRPALEEETNGRVPPRRTVAPRPAPLQARLFRERLAW